MQASEIATNGATGEDIFGRRTNGRMSGPRVALFTDADVFAGTERHIYELARNLQEENCEVRVACPTPAILADRAKEAGLSVLPIQKGGLVDRAAVKTLIPLLKSSKLEIIHAHNGRTALSAALGVFMAKRGCCILTQHFLEPNHVGQHGIKGNVSHLAHRWVNRRAARIIAISEAVRAAMLARGDAPDAKICVIPNGITAPKGVALTSPESLRVEWRIAGDAPLVVCVARLEKEKDIASLVEAMRQVAAANPQARCLIAGDGSERAVLQTQIETSGLTSQVRLLGFRSDALAVIQAADLFVLPSLAEPFGLVLLEAMALAKPIIATRAGGPVEIIADGETGLLVPPNEPAMLAQAIIKLLANPSLRRDMGCKGQVRFEAKFTAARMARATRALYEQALA